MKYSDKNPPLVCMQTQSTCYKGTTTMAIKGVLWHSTGAPNTTLKRYVQPSDKKPSADTYSKSKWLELLGKNKYSNDWNHIDHQAGLNCWIGTLADGTVTTVQTMPWNYKPWGCGKGSKGSCNNGWIQFEICEDYLNDKEYFNAVYEEACEITAYLCKKYNIDPKAKVTHEGVKVPTILCHADSHKLGLGNNHGDVLHWFPKFGKDMDDVRNDVAALINAVTPPPPPPEPEPEPEPASNLLVLDVAKSEIGYYTTGDGDSGTLKSKYAKYFDDNHYYGAHDSRNYYNLTKNGFHWCSMFVDWCFVQAYGETTARHITYHADTYLAGAGCEFSARAYYKNGQFFTDNPQPGDEIFFDWGNGGKAKSLSDCDRADHTGLVYSVQGDKIITIEGNTSDSNGHYSAVAKKTRYLSSASTLGFGRPKWNDIQKPSPLPNPNPEPEPPDEPDPTPDPDPEVPTPEPVLTNRALLDIAYQEYKSKYHVTGDGDSGTLKNKYAQYLDTITGFYNGRKNGYHWCAIFVDWCFVQAYGVSKAKKITYHTTSGAGCGYCAKAYYNKGRFFTKNPQPGDEIFFDWDGGGKVKSANDCLRAHHTGIVYKVDGDKITTIEGNTSDGNGHYSAVAKKTRKLSADTTMGFGRPVWEQVEEHDPEDPSPWTPEIPEEPQIEPPTVTNLKIDKVFTEYATAEVNIFGEEISSVTYTLSNGKTSSLSTSDSSLNFKISDLIPNTTYSITVTAENSSGSDSATTSFKTLQDYPSPIQGISLKSTTSTKNEADLFSATVSPPERWGYWKDKAGHDYGYRLFLVSNCRLLAYKDVAAKDKHEFIPVSSFDVEAKHEDNLQAGIITWVIDNTNSKIFDTKDAGTLYPVCSNSICLKELSEMSDILYFSDSGAQRRTQPYMDGQPVKIFKI